MILFTLLYIILKKNSLYNNIFPIQIFNPHYQKYCLKFKEEYSENKDWYYYVYDLTDGITLISPGNDEVIDDNWFVCIMETSPEVQFTDPKDLKDFINLVEKNKIT